MSSLGLFFVCLIANAASFNEVFSAMIYYGSLVDLLMANLGSLNEGWFCDDLLWLVR